MKKIIIIIAIIFIGFLIILKDKRDTDKYANTEKYRTENIKIGLPTEKEARVVFIGDSITELWKYKRPDFFLKNGYINRGIDGQVTLQMLSRFKADVIDLKPKVVVILAGTNDIAQNGGSKNLKIEDIAKNIFSMVKMAKNQGIKVIVCSVLPAIDYPWRPGLEPAHKIIKLNEIIKNFAKKNNYMYVDYYSHMVDEKGGLKVPEYTSEEDLVHPNNNGYNIMEKLVKYAIDDALNNDG